jgi:PAS domain S-box-containing protein
MGKTKILVVDDNPTNLIIAQRSIRSLDVSCIPAKSGTEALEQVKKHEFAVILLDVQMPGMDGFETARRLKANPSTESVPIIFLTALNKTDINEVEGYTSGAVDLLFKPIQPKIVRSKVKVFVELYRQKRVIAEQARGLQEQIDKMKGFTQSIARRDRHVEKLTEARAALEESELKFRTLVNNIPGVTYRRSAGERWRIEYISEKVEALTGYPVKAFKEGERTTFETLVCEEDRERVNEEIKTALEERREFDLTYPIRHVNGTIRQVRDRGQGLYDDDDNVRLIDGAIFDVTRDWEREEELRNAMEEAETANQAKSLFLANISHELRTPLHAVKNFSGFGIKRFDRVNKEKLIYYFTKIHTAGDTLLHLVDELLDLAKHESGKMDFHFAIEDLVPVLTNVVDEFASHISSKNLSLRWTPPKDPQRTNFDSDRIKQVLRNLLSNAVKFSPEGGTISVELSQGVHRIRVTVRDEGLGIPEDEIETVFEQFVQSSKTSTGAGVTGLGLAISREIVKGHNGHIWAENNPDGGAAFHFEIVHEPDTSVDLDIGVTLLED